jgi:hypothetical protein
LTASGEDGYIFASGITKPEHSDFLSYLYPQYLATAIFDRLGRSEGKGQSVWSWSELDRTRKGTIIANLGTVTTNTILVITDVDAANGSDGYYIVKDQLISVTGVVFIVDAVGVDTGKQTLTLRRADGTDPVQGDIPAGSGLGHLASAFGEYSVAPKGRLHLPNERHNKLQIARRSAEMSGSMLTDRVYISPGNWAYNEEMIVSDEFARDRENMVMFSQESPEGAAEQTCDGIVTAVTRGGVVTTYGATITETDIQDHIKALTISSPAKEYLVFVGAQFQQDASVALKDYSLAGAQNYGSFGGKAMVGLDLDGYRFMNKTIHFVHYPPFDDVETLPTGAGTSAQVDYSNFSLWLNMGTERGKKLITLKHKELDGKQRKLIVKSEDGMMGDSKKVANGDDGQKTHFLSEMAPEVRNLNQHGILRSAV